MEFKEALEGIYLNMNLVSRIYISNKLPNQYRI